MLMSDPGLGRLDFGLASLRSALASGRATPRDIVREAYSRIEADGRSGVWIALRDVDEALERADRGIGLPLAGVPFSVKDNIDVAGLPTTAACPAFAYRPAESARVVARLEAAGAVCIGKVNMDQFATGLNGTRSPYGACGSAFDPAMIAGGSSSGSAVSVGLHQVCFSIGTDTGGSGRIPAGLNNVVGLKPTRGVLSLLGIVPCCRSLDCPALFTLGVEDAVELATIAFEQDLADPSLRDDAGRASFRIGPTEGPYRVLVPRGDQRAFFGNEAGAILYETSLATLEGLGAVVQEIDFAPFVEAGRLLFDGPFVADRHASVGAFVESHADEVLDTTRSIIAGGRTWSAVSAFEAFHRLAVIRASVRTLFGSDGILVVPTVAPLDSIADMLADPVGRNTANGHYSYFVNPLDLCALAVPFGFHPSGMPFGLTLIAPAFEDARVAGLARALSARLALPAGKPRP